MTEVLAECKELRKPSSLASLHNLRSPLASKAMNLGEKGIGWHAFRRYRKTWLRGKRCQEDINNSCTGHKPETMSELYSRMDEELEKRLQEAELVGVGFKVPAYLPLLPQSSGRIGS